MTKTEAKALWLYLREQWRNYELPTDAQTAEIRVQVWMDLLSDLDAGAIRCGISSLSVREFPPSPGQIRQATLDLMRAGSGESGIPDVDTALDEVFGAIASHGHVRLPEWSHPAIGSAVRALGGWLEVCRSENIEALRAHFRALYGAASTRAERESYEPCPILAAAAVGIGTMPELGR